MGVQDLLPFLRKQAPNGYRADAALADYRGRTMGIDANVNMNSFVKTFTPCAVGFAQLAIMLLAHDIRPVFVFDGPAGALKTRTKAKRDEIRHKSQAVLEEKLKTPEIYTTEELEKAERQTLKPTNKDRDSSIAVLRLVGVPVFQAPGEADLLLATMHRHKLIDGCFTKDGDFIAHGISPVVSGLSPHKAHGMQEYKLELILPDLQLSRDEFIDMCLLIGTDYTERVKMIGPGRAWDFIKKYKTVEAVRTALQPRKSYYVFPPDDCFPIDSARKAFSTDDAVAVNALQAVADVVREAILTDTIDATALRSVEPLIDQRLADWFCTTWQSLRSAQVAGTLQRFRWQMPDAFAVSVISTVTGVAAVSKYSAGECLLKPSTVRRRPVPAQAIAPNQEASATGTIASHQEVSTANPDPAAAAGISTPYQEESGTTAQHDANTGNAAPYEEVAAAEDGDAADPVSRKRKRDAVN